MRIYFKLLNTHGFYVFHHSFEVSGVRIPKLVVRLDAGLVVDVVPSDAVVAVERQAPPDHERPLYLPRLLEQIRTRLPCALTGK